MSLYETLAPIYDRLFPVNPAFLSFLDRERIRPREDRRPRALDAGSATGGHVLALAEAGWEAVGIEPSSAMTAVAREATAREATVRKTVAREEGAVAAAARFIEGDMRDAEFLLGEGARLDLVLCLGNTLPHLTGDGDLAAFFGAARRLLAGPRADEGPNEDGAAILLQVLNYGAVSGPNSRVGPGFSFPELRAGEVVMRRRYEAGPAPGRLLRFIVELEVEGGAPGKAAMEETLLRPYRPAEISAALAAAGFRSEESFAAWGGEVFHPESDPYLIVLARA